MHNYKIGDKVLSPKFPNDKLFVNGIRAEEVEVKSTSGALTWLLPSDLSPDLSRLARLEVGKCYILDATFPNTRKNVVELVEILGKYFCRVKIPDSDAQSPWDVMQVRLSEI